MSKKLSSLKKAELRELVLDISREVAIEKSNFLMLMPCGYRPVTISNVVADFLGMTEASYFEVDPDDYEEGEVVTDNDDE